MLPDRRLVILLFAVFLAFMMAFVLRWHDVRSVNLYEATPVSWITHP